jgi:hypothetical protein
MGMQQHENSPQSMQRVEPGAEVLTMLSTVDEAAEPGPLWFTGDKCVVPQAMSSE